MASKLKLINIKKETDKQKQKIFSNRSLNVDYRTLQPILTKGMTVLNVGCGTGSISKDIANLVGDFGKIIGIDNTGIFIRSGKKIYGNLTTIHFCRNPDFYGNSY